MRDDDEAMSQENGDHNMADTTAGAEMDGGEYGEDIMVEKQRLRMVRAFLVFPSSDRN